MAKTYKCKASLKKRIDQTPLKYVDYDIAIVDGKYTAKFHCYSDLEIKVVIKEGFSYEKF